ncbi:MAG: GNAT family N-acetyltransferase [Caldilineaceae bacterium]|nr:GNAT family N-acetyltransferase [Caldilineaceae bacterium]
MTIDIRRRQSGDEQLALRVVRDLIPAEERDGGEPTITLLQRMLGQESDYLIVALAEGAPVGLLSAYHMPSLSSDSLMAYLHEVAVVAAYQRQGIGKRMVELFKMLCLASAVDYIWVGTENTNAAAKRLYESTGGVWAEADSCEYVYELTLPAW